TGLVAFMPSFAQAEPTRYEAESATLSQATVASNHTGFSGAGFVDYTNVAGSSVQWTVNVSSAGTTKLSFRYANGSTADRPMDISVNGSLAMGGVSFPATANWDTWQTVTITATLNAGSNTIKATAVNATGGPNVDSLEADQTAAAPTVPQAENPTTSQSTVANPPTRCTRTWLVHFTN